ncbi:hypothetical protein [Streptomyces sp. NPDC004014]
MLPSVWDKLTGVQQWMCEQFLGIELATEAQRLALSLVVVPRLLSRAERTFSSSTVDWSQLSSNRRLGGRMAGSGLVLRW